MKKVRLIFYEKPVIPTKVVEIMVFFKLKNARAFNFWVDYEEKWRVKHSKDWLKVVPQLAEKEIRSNTRYIKQIMNI